MTVCTNGASWTAEGTAVIRDTWDFDWTWSNLYEEWKVKLRTGRINLGGRETRTSLGSLIPGDPFAVTSVDVPVKQSNGDPLLVFGP